MVFDTFDFDEDVAIVVVLVDVDDVNDEFMCHVCAFDTVDE